MLPILVAICLLAQPGAADESGIDFFEKKIRPVLAESCYRCHGPRGKPKGGLRLDTREALFQGGGRGPVVIPGEPQRSILIRAIRHEDEKLKMPPKEKLSPEVIADFADWVAMGAPYPGAAPQAARPAGARSVADLWALRPPRETAPPPVSREGWARSDADRFILARLEASGLEPSPSADPRTLVRRLSYDLTGLPPSRQDVETFAKDPSDQAWEGIVDRFLSSPRFGERWGRYWLDVARYADTKGYVYSDREEGKFVHSHVYRDWVIRAFNEDLPYDRFLMLQLAADRLVDEGGDQRDLAALGFLTLGRRLLGNIHDIIDDRIDVMMRGTQALTASCARCHDHKFDPIPTRDYYSLYGVLQGSMEKLVCLDRSPKETAELVAYQKGLKEREEKLERAYLKKREEMSERLKSKVVEYLAAVLEVEKLPTEEFYVLRGPDELNPVVARYWQTYLFQTDKSFHPVFAPWHALARLPAERFAVRAPEAIASAAAAGAVNPLVLEALVRPPPATMRDAAERYGKLLLRARDRWKEALAAAGKAGSPPPAALPHPSALADPAEDELRQVLYGPDSPATVPTGPISEIEWFFDEPTRVELAKLQADIERWIISSPGSPPHAVILADRASQRNPRVFIRGNPANRGEETPRRFLEALSGPNREPFRIGSGRLELARAIAAKENPLTARVMVNRVWLDLFGAGLVATPSDFGARSEPPTHPELLDWLALRFMEDGWSVKRLIRRLVLSSVYRQDSLDQPEGLRLDPENMLLWKASRKRLDFEALRDSLLAASGELDLTLGGRPVDLLAEPLSGRRTVYGFIDRQFLPGVFRVFDFANPDQHSPRRHATTVPQQALYLMNSPFVAGRARALAASIEADSAGLGPLGPTADPGERVRRFYRRVYQREPAPRELEVGAAFLGQQPAVPPAPAPPPPSPWRYGYGEVDEAAGRVKTFDLLPHFTGEAFQGGEAWPDPKLGWVQLKAGGGHAGDDLAHAAIRRWLAPQDLAVSIGGKLGHPNAQGDGIRARIISSRAGVLAGWTLHQKTVEATVDRVELKAGDTLDFVVDRGNDLNSDDFTWAPVVKRIEPTAGGGPADWDARRDFAGAQSKPPPPLTPGEMYAQALLLSNEFVFID